jgi:hypothetical protein
MLYAASEDGAKIRAEPDAVGFCPGCGETLVPRCGEVNIWHWAHQAGRDCDDWYEPETAWHLWWKELAPAEHREVVVGQHRADVLGSRGVVVELQHSSISPETIAEREAFYDKMVWIVDARGYNSRIKLRRWRYEDKTIDFYLSWKWPRTCWYQATRPVFFDIGFGVFQVEDMTIGRETTVRDWGWHKVVSRKTYIGDKWLIWITQFGSKYHDVKLTRRNLIVSKYFS